MQRRVSSGRSSDRPQRDAAGELVERALQHGRDRRRDVQRRVDDAALVPGDLAVADANENGELPPSEAAGVTGGPDGATCVSPGLIRGHGLTVSPHQSRVKTDPSGNLWRVRFAENLDRELRARRISAPRMSELIDGRVSAKQIARYRRGEVMPPLDVAAVIADVLGMTIDELAGASAPDIVMRHGDDVVAVEVKTLRQDLAAIERQARELLEAAERLSRERAGEPQ